MGKYNIIDRAKHTFFQLPKVLVFGEKYKSTLKAIDRNAYAVLLDRLSVSIKNNWVDENGDIYFVYSNESLMETLNVSKPTLAHLKKRLRDADLLVEERTGRANRLYLLEPIVSNADEAKYILETEKANAVDKTKVSEEERTQRSKRLIESNKSRTKLKNLTSSGKKPHEVKNLNIRSKETEHQKVSFLPPSKNNIVRRKELGEKIDDDDDLNRELEKIITSRITKKLKNAGIQNLTETKLLPIARSMNKLMVVHNQSHEKAEAMILFAIEIYELNNGRSINYLIKLLTDWDESKLHTVEAVRKYIEDYRNNRSESFNDDGDPVPMINWLKELNK